LRSPWSERVYTILLVSIVGFTIASAAPVRVTVDPTMVKGPATAPVTIIEFSDYQ
jgi:protein-disulfide isomerase